MPADDKNGLEYITLDDFSAGIYDDWYSAGGAQAAPQGAAQLTGTYGCVAGQGGGLIAAPRRVNRILESPQAAPSALDPYTHITAFRALSPVYDRTGVASGTAGTPRAYPDQLFVCFEWYSAANAHKSLIRTYKPYKLTAANPALGGVTTYDIQSKTSASGQTVLLYGYSSVDISRNNPSSPTDPGYPTVCVSFTSCRDGTGGQLMYPDPDTPTTDSSEAIAGLNVSGGSACYALMAHQDRMMCFQTSVNFGFATNGEVPFDGIIGTAPNDFRTNGFTVSTFVNENPGLFGSWASVNASEAFFVKQQHGGYDVRGDVGNPTVVRLPGVEPTGDAINIGTLTADGIYVYGTRNGVYGWSGGDTSPYLSPQIDGWFWKPGSGLTGVDNYLYTKGQFSRQGRYVFAPNNFLFDTGKGSWWKLTNPADTTTPTYGFWDASANGLIVGVPTYLSASQTVLADWYDTQQGQSSFQWTSQPLKVTQGRVVEFREWDLVAQGVGTITVTVTGLNGTSVSETYTINSASQPITINKMSSCQAHDAVITIASTATSSSAAAPRVYRLTFGLETLMTARPAQ